MANAINWFEIPATNLNRAREFYSKVLGTEMAIQEIMGNQMAFFPYEPGSGLVSGALCQGDGYTPNSGGALIYLNGGSDLATPLARVEEAGGKIELPKTKISDEIGFMAIFHDTEGNRVAFHSPS